MTDSRVAVLESVAYGDDPRVTPGDRLRAIEQLEQLGTFRNEKADDGLSEDEILAEADSFHAMMLATMRVASGPDLDLDLAKFPNTTKALRELVDAEVERTLANRILEAEQKRRARADEQREELATELADDDVVDGVSVDVPDVAAEAALPAPTPVRELPPGIDLSAGWPRPPGPGDGFVRGR